MGRIVGEREGEDKECWDLSGENVLVKSAAFVVLVENWASDSCFCSGGEIGIK